MSELCKLMGIKISLHSLVAQTENNLPAMQETWVQTLRWEDRLEKEMATHSSIRAWKLHGQRRLVGYVHGDAKIQI